MQERTERVGSVPSDRMLPTEAYDVFEWISIIVFTAEYLLHIAAAPKASVAVEGYSSRLGYLTSFFGLVDLLTIAPFYVEIILRSVGVQFDAAPFRVFRVFRIFQLDRLCGAFSTMAAAFRSCSETLVAFGLVALIIWIGAASLFYVFEKHNDLEPLQEAFSSIPSSMYYTAIFLGGEWGETDFTVGGKLVCIALVAIGIELYAIPIRCASPVRGLRGVVALVDTAVGAFAHSVLFDAFQDVLEDEEDEDEDEDGGPRGSE